MAWKARSGSSVPTTARPTALVTAMLRDLRSARSMDCLAKYSRPAGTSSIGAQFGAEASIAASIAPTRPSPTSPIVCTARLPRVTSQIERRLSSATTATTSDADAAQ